MNILTISIKETSDLWYYAQLCTILNWYKGVPWSYHSTNASFLILSRRREIWNYFSIWLQKLVNIQCSGHGSTYIFRRKILMMNRRRIPSVSTYCTISRARIILSRFRILSLFLILEFIRWFMNMWIYNFETVTILWETQQIYLNAFSHRQL